MGMDQTLFHLTDALIAALFHVMQTCNPQNLIISKSRDMPSLLFDEMMQQLTSGCTVTSNLQYVFHYEGSMKGRLSDFFSCRFPHITYLPIDI